MSFLHKVADNAHTYFYPEHALKEKYLGKAYAKHPLGARIAVISGNVFTGAGKPLLVPIISALGLLVMPAIAAYHAIINKNYKEAGSWLAATSVCVLGIGASIAFMAITAYCMPIIWGSVLFITIVTINVSYQVYKAVKEPKHNLQDQDSVKTKS